MAQNWKDIAKRMGRQAEEQRRDNAGAELPAGMRDVLRQRRAAYDARVAVGDRAGEATSKGEPERRLWGKHLIEAGIFRDDDVTPGPDAPTDEEFHSFLKRKGVDEAVAQADRKREGEFHLNTSKKPDSGVNPVNPDDLQPA